MTPGKTKIATKKTERRENPKAGERVGGKIIFRWDCAVLGEGAGWCVTVV